MTTLLIAALIAAGFALIAAEIILPGGIAGMVGLAAMVAAVVLGFRESAAMGIGALVAAALGVPGALMLGLWRLPHSRWGRKVALNPPRGIGYRPQRWNDTANTAAGETPLSIGRDGVALTALRPSGRASIDGQTFDVVTRGEAIDRGARIRVVAGEGGRVVVEIAE